MSEMPCSVCGAIASPSDRFCRQCGASLPSGEAATFETGTSFRVMTTGDLLDIWKMGNHAAFSQADFASIAAILGERGVELPAQRGNGSPRMAGGTAALGGDGSVGPESGDMPGLSPAQSFAWHEAWIKSVTKPDVKTYLALLRDPRASAGRAFRWIFLVALITQGIPVIAYLVLYLMSLLKLGSASNIKGLTFGSTLALIGLVPLYAAAAALGLFFIAAVIHWVARMLGGKGTFSEMVYAMSAYAAPFFVMSWLVIGIPFWACIGLPIGIYVVILTLTAIRAVHGFGWGKAIGTFILCALIIAFLGGMLYGAIDLISARG